MSWIAINDQDFAGLFFKCRDNIVKATFQHDLIKGIIHEKHIFIIVKFIINDIGIYDSKLGFKSFYPIITSAIVPGDVA
jgi:hypothetical protein